MTLETFHVFERAVDTWIFPNPLFNVDDKTLLSNYRPISVLPVFSKILEHMYNHISTYLSKHYLLYKK